MEGVSSYADAASRIGEIGVPLFAIARSVLGGEKMVPPLSLAR